MKVTVNLEDEEFAETALSVSEIMLRKRFTFPHIITRLNGRLVEREKRGTTLVSDGDDLEIYHLISGG
ncbi:MAG: sulfur carrier protein ThiS [Rectinemataceae bacterium]